MMSVAFAIQTCRPVRSRTRRFSLSASTIVVPSREYAIAWASPTGNRLSHRMVPFPVYIRMRLLNAVTKLDPSGATAMRFCVRFSSAHSRFSFGSISWMSLLVERSIRSPDGMILTALMVMVSLDAIPSPENVRVRIFPPPAAAMKDKSGASEISLTAISMFLSHIRVPAPERRRSSVPFPVRI
ncbi:MAG: hypothetical protein A4E33_01516 [Methanoregula sp. PtaB.Bin085]|nr:MAG: hypothetical protein A4E33_01516 [Methanoregula sp. PtaB.Bin085]